MNLEGLSKEQQDIIKNINGPMVVIAGPGTGKTYTIVKKIVYLLTEKSVSPESILITTFTNKAANELKTRITTELHNNGFSIDTSKLKIGTIHSIALKILDLKDIFVLDTWEQGYLIYKNKILFEKIEGFRLLESYLSSIKGGFWYNLQQLFNILSENSVSSDELIKSKWKYLRILGNLYDTYLFLLNREGILDFSQILSKCLNLLKTDSKILNSLKDEINYIIVDEYQDTNNLQKDILLTLVNNQKNICVVGDDDQSIYRFRGADVENILNFSYFFPKDKCKIYFLTKNYRSPNEIISFFSNFIKDKFSSERRYKKELVSEKNSNTHRVFKISHKNFSEIGKKIASFIKELQFNGTINDLSEISFLFKTTRYGEAKILSDTLKECGLPVFSPRSGDFFKKEEVKIIIGFMLSINKNFSKSLFNKSKLQLLPHEIYYKKVIFEFLDFIKGDTKDKLVNLNYLNTEQWIKNKILSIESNENKNHYDKFIDIFFESLEFYPFNNLFTWDTNESVFIKDEKQQRHKNISLLLKIVNNFENRYQSIFQEDFFNDYLPFLMDSGVNEFENREDLTLDGHITFLTFHQSKGLEFPFVFVGSLDQNPKKNEKNKIIELLNREHIYKFNYNFSQLESEDFYRLYYTAFSRSKEFLFLMAKDNSDEENVKFISPSTIFKETFFNLREYSDFFNTNSRYKLKKEKTSEKMKIFSYTSDISLYEECPLKYRFYKVLDFPKNPSSYELLGTLIHKTVEDLIKEFLKINYTLNSNQFDTITKIQDYLKKNYSYIKKSYKNDFIMDKKTAQENIQDIYNFFINETQNIVGSEIDFTAVRKNYILKGVLDILKIQNQGNLNERPTYEIIDIKTTKNNLEESVTNYLTQLLIYGYLCENNGYKVDLTSLYYIKGKNNSGISINFKMEDALKRLNKIDINVNKILNEEFLQNKSNLEYCKNCKLKYYCKIEKNT